MTTPLLSINNLSVFFENQYTWQAVVNNISFDIYSGECLGLVGESGSGKSLTASSILQLLPASATINSTASITFKGSDLLRCTEREMQHIRGKKIAMIFQDAMSTLNPVLTIAQQINELLKVHRIIRPNQFEATAIELLKDVGIKDPQRCYHSYPHQLSGGMRQRAMIAMAICTQPQLLIADEATTALDVTVQAQVLSLLKSLQKKYNMALLFISHDLAVVSKMADSIIVMQEGNIVEQETTASFFKNPQHPYSKKLLGSLPQPNKTIINTDNKTLIPVLSAKNLQVHFPIKKGILKRTVDYVKAVNHLNITLNKGETLALVGESGSGKTTTAKAILQLLNEARGTIQLNDTKLTLPSRNHQCIRDNIQVIFQDPYAALNPRITIGNSLIEGLLAHKVYSNKKQALNSIDSLLEKVNLPTTIKHRYPHEFSGGERQRICIARALALKPKILILDEPTSSLDVSIQHQVLTLLKSLQNEFDLTYLLITHNIALVANLAHQVAVMQHGEIKETGPTLTILNNPTHPYTQTLLQAVPTID